MARSTPQINDPREAIDQYAQRLRELLEHCERALKERNYEAFLWNARRSLETICRLLITNKKMEVSRGEQQLHMLVQFLRTEKVLDEQQGNRFEAVQKHSNLGVHIRNPERENYKAAVKDLQHLLPEVVEWLVTESPIHGHLPYALDLQRLAQRLSPLASDSLNRVTPSPYGVPSPTATTDAPTTEDSQGYTATQTTDGTGTTQVRTRAGGSDTDPTAITEATDAGDPHGGLLVTDPTVPKAAPARRRNALWIGGTVAVAAFAGVWLFLTTYDARPTVDATPAPEAAVAVVAPPPVAESERGAEREIEPRIEPPPPPPAPTCPPGLTLIPASTITIGQPIGGRKNWPQPKPATIAPIDVPAFCVQPAPVTFTEWRAWPRHDEATLKSDCKWGIANAPKAPGSPVHCVGRAAAVAYCAEQLPGGHLPSIVEWEALARSEAKNLGESGVQFEWAGDQFPPAVFNRRAEPCREAFCDDGMIKQTLDPKSEVRPVGDVLWSWSTRKKGESHNELTFRCAVAPTL
ncbi:formylglycine-generating enzyme family protein [Myxococcota bacterium]|nr:formylglycine-generating enzyme family protein [Myxococcota bacterium]